MIAGPNGSGKSTLKAKLEAAGVDFGDYLNADDIARTLSGDPVEVGKQAQAIVRERRDRALADRRDYSWETVMSHPSHVEHLRAAREAGYEVRLLYVATEDPANNIVRVTERVGAGGHDVPQDRIVSRYHKSLAGLLDAVEAAHQARLFDNSERERPFRLVATRGPDGVRVLSDAPAWLERHLLEPLRDRQSLAVADLPPPQEGRGGRPGRGPRRDVRRRTR